MDLNAGQLTRWTYSGLMQWTIGAYEESWTFAGTTLSEMPTSIAIPKPLLSSITKSRRFTFFGHLAWMDENADASQAIFKPPPENWRWPPVRPLSTWMKNTHDDLSSLDLGIYETRDLVQNQPLWRLMSLHSAKHSWWCMLLLDWTGRCADSCNKIT